MLLANKLTPGDSIGFFSPSAPVTKTAPKRFERAKQFLRRKGFNLVEGNLTGKSDFYRSGSIKERAEELNDLIRKPDVKCIISTVGGNNSNSLLPYIDYEQLIKTPKIIIGYSDMTAILLGIYAKTGLITYYGPALVASFGEMPPLVDIIYQYFSDMLVEVCENPYTLPTPKFYSDEFIDWESQKEPKKMQKNEVITVAAGKAAGRLIGGNLNTIEGIWGSEYMPMIKSGDILFIEDSLKNPSIIERSFSLLKLNGIFDKIGGLVLGKHEQYKDLGSGKKPYETLLEVIGKPRFPILADFDCSHTHPMLTLPIGCEAELDAANKTLRIMNKWVIVD